MVVIELHQEDTDMETLMKRTQLLVSLIAVPLLGYGAFLLEPAEAGCSKNGGCGVSRTQSQFAPASQAQASQYTCPMHPELYQTSPASALSVEWYP